MRTPAGFALALLLPFCALAQNRAGASHNTTSSYGSLGGFGNVVYPGIGHAPGLNPHPGFGYSFGNYSHHSRAAAVPYAYPVILGGFGGYYGGYDEAPPPEQYPVQAYQPSPSGPQVIINQNFLPQPGHPVIHEYGPDEPSGDGIRRYEPAARDSAPADSADESYYLIAFKDHSIYSAFAYWVDGDTLHYVTPQRVHNQASLNMVDRDLTSKLNHGQSLQVKLP